MRTSRKGVFYVYYIHSHTELDTNTLSITTSFSVVGVSCLTQLFETRPDCFRRNLHISVTTYFELLLRQVKHPVSQQAAGEKNWEWPSS